MQVIDVINKPYGLKETTYPTSVMRDVYDFMTDILNYDATSETTRDTTRDATRNTVSKPELPKEPIEWIAPAGHRFPKHALQSEEPLNREPPPEAL